MCDFNKISGLIIAAQVAFLASLVIVAAAVALGSNPFTSAANIPAMVISAIAAGVATASLIAAIAALDACLTGPCAAEVSTLRNNLIALSVAVGTYCVMLAALAIIAGVPFAGSVAAAALCVWAVSLTTLFAAVATGYLGNAIQGFNTCMQRQGNGNNGTTTTIVVLTVVIVLVAVVVSASAGAANGVLPCFGPFC